MNKQLYWIERSEDDAFLESGSAKCSRHWRWQVPPWSASANSFTRAYSTKSPGTLKIDRLLHEVEGGVVGSEECMFLSLSLSLSPYTNTHKHTHTHTHTQRHTHTLVSQLFLVLIFPLLLRCVGSSICEHNCQRKSHDRAHITYHDSCHRISYKSQKNHDINIVNGNRM